MVAEAPPIDVRLRADLIRPLPSQARFLDDMWKLKYLLYGGAAGPGKSHILRWALIEFLIYWGVVRGVRNMRVGLFCEDYPTLKDRHLSKFTSGLINRSNLTMEQALEQGMMEAEFPPWLGQLKETKAEGLCFFLPDSLGGGFIALRNLDDPSKYASSEFAMIAVDELTKNLRQTFDDLRFRLRWPGVPHSPFIAASNPGSRGHAWVKQLFVDRDFTVDENTRINPDLVGFIPALPRENPHLTKEYWALLHSLPGAMQRAMEEGDWNVFAGQAFPEWRAHLHVVEPFAVPADWAKWTATDYGFVAPRCTLWFARDPASRNIFVYREQYEVGVRAKEQAARIAYASAGEKITVHAGDPSMWQTREDDKGGTSLAQEYQMGGIHLVRANNNRLAGKGYVHDVLSWSDERGEQVREPRLRVFKTCTNLVRTLPALPLDDIRPEDVDTHAEDHCLIAGTLVETDRGAVPIAELVGHEGYVRSHDGRWHRFHSGRRTQRQAPVHRLTLMDGRSVTATAGHRFMLSDGTWRRLRDLRHGDSLLDLARTVRYIALRDVLHRDRHQRDRSRVPGAAILSLRSLLPAQGEAAASRGLGGARGTDPRGLSRPPPVRTRPKSDPRTGVGHTRPACPAPPRHAATAQRAPSEPESDRRMASLAGGPRVASRARPRDVGAPAADDGYLRRVRAGVQNPLPDPLQVLSAELPGEGVSQAAVVSRVEPAGIADVFNIAVEETHTFAIAGGLVVHNCYDALRYGLSVERGGMSRQAVRDTGPKRARMPV